MGAHAIARRAPVAASSGDARAALDAIRRIVRAIRVSSRAIEKQLGVSGAQLFVLESLYAGPAGSIADLARRTLTDPSSVSVVVSRLADKGLVSRVASAADARRAEIALTRKGRALLDRAPRPAQALLVEAVERLPAAQLRSLARGLEGLVAAIGQEGERAAMFFEEDAEGSRGSR